MKINRPRKTAKLLRAELNEIANQCRKCEHYPGSEELCADCAILARSVGSLICAAKRRKSAVFCRPLISRPETPEKAFSGRIPRACSTWDT